MFPCEASGILLRRDFRRFTILTFVRTRSDENTPFSFRITDSDIQRISESFVDLHTRIGGCAHSHPLGRAVPSSIDSTAIKEPGDLWLIYSIRFHHLNLFQWNQTSFQKVSFEIAPF
ncbi:MAG: Mov34/MPN/PAD-1 family protein [Bacteroidota bacterium]